MEMCNFRVLPIFREECFDVDESPLFRLFFSSEVEIDVNLFFHSPDIFGRL